MATPPNDLKGIVAKGYDAAAHRYAALEEEQEWPRMRWLSDLLVRLPEGSRVVDLGCGAGTPATQAIASRHRVTGVDISRAQIELARQNVPEARFLCADVTKVRFASASLDAVVSFYAIDHVPRDEHAGLFQRIHRWLRPGGFLLIAIEAGDEPGVVGDWLGATMFFSHFDAETNLRLLRHAGFSVLREAIETQIEQGRDVPFLWVLACKPSDHTC